DRGSPLHVGDHVRHHGGGGRACVRRTGAPSVAYSTDRGAAAALTYVLGFSRSRVVLGNRNCSREVAQCLEWIIFWRDLRCTDGGSTAHTIVRWCVTVRPSWRRS